MRIKTTINGRRMSGALFCALLISSLAFSVLESPAAEAAPLPGFQDNVVFSGLLNPIAMEFAPDGRVFVAEKSGLIKVFDDLADPTPTQFADLRTQVHNFWDRGLLGLALHPNFPVSPWVYVSYTHDAVIGGSAPRWGAAGGTSDPCPNPPGATGNGCVVSGRLSRLQASGNTMTGAEDVLIEDWCQQYPSHSLGELAFGPDGALYMSGGEGASFTLMDYGQNGDPLNPCGDPPAGVGGIQSSPSSQGGALRAQDIRTAADPVNLNGSIIRVDPSTGDALPSNPMAGSSDLNQRRVIAYGLRNPFRFAFRPGTDELYVGDVGWNAFEEVNRIGDVNDATVENFGWPCYEGAARQPAFDAANFTMCEDLYGDPASGYTTPFFQYAGTSPAHSGDACVINGASLSGVAFYEGGNYPAEFDGAMFLADYSRNCIWSMRAGTGGEPDPSTTAAFVVNAAAPVDLEMGPAGDLFYADFNGGTIRRVSYSGSNRPPTASVRAEPTTGTPPLEVAFDGSASSDPDGDTITYSWDLDGDGIFGDSTSVDPTFDYEAGRYTVKLRVTDPSGASDTASTTITASDPPVADIDEPDGTSLWRVGDTINFSGSATDAQDGALMPSALSWSLILHHCSTPSTCHAHPVQDFEGVSGGSFVAPDHDHPSYLELELRATDSHGLSHTESVRLDPQAATLEMRSSPPGLKLLVGSSEKTTPFTVTTIAGGTTSIGAPSPQDQGGAQYEFSSWSDGGAATHDVTVNADRILTATYFASQQPVFGSPAHIAAGNKPHSVIVQDVTGDSNPDIVTGNSGSSAVGLLRGNGDGTFASVVEIPAGSGVKYTNVGDFNGDGVIDLTTANEQSNSVGLLLGTGGGNFQPHFSYPVCSRPHEVKVSDLNEDGHQDLVVPCWNGQVVSVLLGNGDGTMRPASNYTAGGSPHSVAIVDIDEDGKLDIATAIHGETNISWLKGSGTGTFAGLTRLAVGGAPHEIRSADLNADGHADLVTANDTSNTATVLLGNGNGTFHPAASYATGFSPRSITTGDFNGDGRLDLATADSAGYPSPTNTTSISMLLGNGDGIFRPAIKYGAGPHPFSVVAADLNGDARTDLASTNFNRGSTVTVHLNQTGGGPTSDTTPPSLAGRSPAPNATGVAVGSNATATFNEAIDPASLSFSLKDAANNNIPAAVTYDADTRTATLNPNVDLSAGSTYTASVSGAEDVAGNMMVGTQSWSFTTVAADTSPPSVTGRSPAPNATGVALGSNATVTFNEAIVPSTLSFSLKDPANNVIPAAVTYDAATRTATLNPNADLASETVYTASVSGAADAAGNTMAGVETWSFTSVAANAGVYLSDISPLTVTNGWGIFELDKSNGERTHGDGKTITLNGVTYAKGLGVHSVSEITYNLNGAYSTFNSDIGIDDEVGTKGTVVFKVFVDGVEIYDSGIMTGSSDTKTVSVGVTGANQLRLVVTIGGDTNAYDHADWADAKIIPIG